MTHIALAILELNLWQVLGVIALMPLFGACSMLALAIGATMIGQTAQLSWAAECVLGLIVDRNELMMAIEAGDIPVTAPEWAV